MKTWIRLIFSGLTLALITSSVEALLNFNDEIQALTNGLSVYGTFNPERFADAVIGRSCGLSSTVVFDQNNFTRVAPLSQEYAKRVNNDETLKKQILYNRSSNSAPHSSRNSFHWYVLISSLQAFDAAQRLRSSVAWQDFDRAMVLVAKSCGFHDLNTYGIASLRDHFDGLSKRTFFSPKKPKESDMKKKSAPPSASAKKPVPPSLPIVKEDDRKRRMSVEIEDDGSEEGEPMAGMGHELTPMPGESAEEFDVRVRSLFEFQQQQAKLLRKGVVTDGLLPNVLRASKEDHARIEREREQKEANELVAEDFEIAMQRSIEDENKRRAAEKEEQRRQADAARLLREEQEREYVAMVKAEAEAEAAARKKKEEEDARRRLEEARQREEDDKREQLRLAQERDADRNQKMAVLAKKLEAAKGPSADAQPLKPLPPLDKKQLEKEKKEREELERERKEADRKNKERQEKENKKKLLAKKAAVAKKAAAPTPLATPPGDDA